MKNTQRTNRAKVRICVRTLWFVAIITLIGFVAVSCDDGSTTTPAVPPAITTVSLPDGEVGTAYSQTLEATGDTPITWSIVSGSGTLPGGLTLVPATGVISGTPNAAGTSNFTVKAENAGGENTKALSIVIAPEPTASPTITTTTLPDGDVGVAYSQTLEATGTAPITWSIDSGTLPAGLELAETTGIISGTPTTAGTSNFTVKAENDEGEDTKALSITITAPAGPPILSENFENTAHQFTLENGSAANQWVVGTATANGGTKSLYISNNGAGNAYTLNSASIVHAYIDVEIPANGAVLEFDWKARGEGTTTPYDYLTVFIAPTSTTPAASTSTTFTPPAASQALGTFNMSPVDTWNEAEIPIPAGYNDGEWRLIFTWRNDATGGTQPPVAIDNILLYETTAPTPPAIQTLPSGATWIANFEAENHPFTFVSGTQLNYWMVGASTANSGAKSLYVTNNGGGNNYTINTTSVSHAYTNVTIPATGATTLRFNWKARGEATELRDAFIVYLASAAATVPVAGTLIPAGAEPLGTFNMSLVDTWNEAEIPIPAGYNGGAWRLIFTWRNDSSVGEQPPAAIDDIMLVTSTAPTPPAIQTLPAGATWVANFESENPFTFVSGTQANYWMVGASTANSGAKSLYVTNNGGGNAYTITTTNAAAHAYTNVTIPATGATTLRFNWKARGELADLRDAFIVYLASAAATVPAAGTLIPAGAEPLGTFNMSNVDTWNLAEIPIPAGYNNGGEWRLIFTWRNDNTVGVQPPAAIDDIMLVTSTAPTPPAVQTPPAGSTWSANFESENPFTFVNGTQPNYWMWGSSTANSGAKSLYITNNGAGNSYTITSTNAAAHAYVDVTIPEGSNTLQFNWKARGEGTGTNPADTLRVYIAATSTTPAAGTFAPTASEVLGTFNLSPVDTWNLAEIPIPAGYNNGGEWRLIFTWRNDGSVGAQPPIAIDDIALVPAN